MRTCVLRRNHLLKALIPFDSLLPYSCRVFLNWIMPPTTLMLSDIQWNNINIDSELNWIDLETSGQ